MKKEFIPYEQALALKELGFNEPCIAIYSNANPKTGLYTLKKYRLKLIKQASQKDKGVKAPLYQQAFRWFRETYRLDGKPEYFLNNFYCFIINDMKQEDTSRRLFTEFPSYEEAELACLTKLIEMAHPNK